MVAIPAANITEKSSKCSGPKRDMRCAKGSSSVTPSITLLTI